MTLLYHRIQIANGVSIHSSGKRCVYWCNLFYEFPAVLSDWLKTIVQFNQVKNFGFLWKFLGLLLDKSIVYKKGCFLSDSYKVRWMSPECFPIFRSNYNCGFVKNLSLLMKFGSKSLIYECKY